MTEAAPLLLRIVMLALLLVVGALQALVGYRGLRGQLASDGRLGVRTGATLRTDAAFALANRIAGLPVLIGGVIAVAGGVLQFFAHGTAATVVTAVIAVVGMVVISGAGGLRGHRAAVALLRRQPAGCGGCACGAGGCAAAALQG